MVLHLIHTILSSPTKKKKKKDIYFLMDMLCTPAIVIQVHLALATSFRNGSLYSLKIPCTLIHTHTNPQKGLFSSWCARAEWIGCWVGDQYFVDNLFGPMGLFDDHFIFVHPLERRRLGLSQLSLSTRLNSTIVVKWVVMRVGPTSPSRVLLVVNHNCEHNGLLKENLFLVSIELTWSTPRRGCASSY